MGLGGGLRVLGLSVVVDEAATALAWASSAPERLLFRAISWQEIEGRGSTEK